MRNLPASAPSWFNSRCIQTRALYVQDGLQDDNLRLRSRSAGRRVIFDLEQGAENSNHANFDILHSRRRGAA